MGPFHADDGLQRGQPVLGPVALSDRNGPVERHDRVDQVRRVVPHLRRLANRGLRQHPSGSAF
jgi:hypothetical protein